VLPPGRSGIQTRVLVLVGLIASLALGGFVMMRLTTSDAARPVADVQAFAETNPEVRSELLAGEALMAFPVKRGNYPMSLSKGDVIRVVVTPGPDASGDVRMIEETVVVTDIGGASEVSDEIVLTVQGREEILELLAGSGPIHVARVSVVGVTE
jgi:hypothetical protein